MSVPYNTLRKGTVSSTDTRGGNIDTARSRAEGSVCQVETHHHPSFLSSPPPQRGNPPSSSLSLRIAEMETKLDEMDHARTIHSHASQVGHSRIKTDFNDYNLDCSGAGAVYIRGMALGRSLKFHLDWEERQGQLEEARQVLERLQGRKVDDKVELVIKQSL